MLDGIPSWALWLIAGFLAAVLLLIAYYRFREPLAKRYPTLSRWFPRLFPPPRNRPGADERFDDVDLFQRTVRVYRGRIKRYLRKTFGNQIDVSRVFRSASLEVWHNATDIDNYLHAVDPKDNRQIDEGEWFVRIAHNFARDYIERSGNLDGTAQGVFLEFVRHRLGFWDKLGLAGDGRTDQLVLEFHQRVEELPTEMRRILEEDLNTDLLGASQRRFGQSHPERKKAISFLRHSLGLKSG